jgi:hypothetical protein
VLSRHDLDGRTRLQVALEPAEHARLREHFPPGAIVDPAAENSPARR